MDKPVTTPRDRARSAALGRTITRQETLVEIAGVSYLVKSPSISEASVIRAAGGLGKGKVGKNGDTELELDTSKCTVKAIILLTYIPETGERAFTAADEAMMLTWSEDDPFIQGLGEPATAFMRKADDKAKNSERTTTA